VPEERIGVAVNEDRERITVAREDARNDRLIRIDLVYLIGGHRLFHGVRITASPAGG
jgi:hypothetical protein